MRYLAHIAGNALTLNIYGSKDDRVILEQYRLAVSSKSSSVHSYCSDEFGYDGWTLCIRELDENDYHHLFDLGLEMPSYHELLTRAIAYTEEQNERDREKLFPRQTSTRRRYVPVDKPPDITTLLKSRNSSAENIERAIGVTLKIDINKDRTICLNEFLDTVSLLSEERITAAQINLQQLLNKFTANAPSDSNVWLQIITHGLPTLLNWYENRKQKMIEMGHSSIIPSKSELLFAYIKSAILQREQIMLESGQKLPKNLKEKTLEYLINLADNMSKNKILVVQTANLSPSNWAMKFFGDPWLGANPVGIRALNLIRECAQEFVESNHDGSWQFVAPELIEPIRTCAFLVSYDIEATIHESFNDKLSRSKETMKIFAETLFDNPNGIWVYSSGEPWSTIHSHDELCEQIKTRTALGPK